MRELVSIQGRARTRTREKAPKQRPSDDLYPYYVLHFIPSTRFNTFITVKIFNLTSRPCVYKNIFLFIFDYDGEIVIFII